MSKYKTHSEIISEIRLKCARAYWSEDSLHPNGDIPEIKCLEPHKLATQLESAHKREVDDLKKQIALLSKKLKNDNSATATVTGGEHGNVDKLREAVNLLIDALRDMIMGVGKRDKNRAAIAAGLSALAAPRNCDVGAASEQDERFSAFCNRYYNERGLCDKDCPCRDFNMIGGACSILWGQMPYESEVKNG